MLEVHLKSFGCKRLKLTESFWHGPCAKDLGFAKSISVSAPHSTHFVPSSSSEPSVSEAVSETVKPPVSEVVKPIEVSPSRKIRVNLKESEIKESTLSKD